MEPIDFGRLIRMYIVSIVGSLTFCLVPVIEVDVSVCVFFFCEISKH